ncbi:MAG: PHP domain-containing protein [Desulfobacterales bacterium]|nr:PHP domain-containing protein [Desulfobacterales bacterium]
MDYKSGKIDLHIHSTASDGSLSPDAILALAAEQDLCAIALTDHDSVEGVKTLLNAQPPTQLDLLTGVEISAAPPPAFRLHGSIHLLGYGMDVYHSGFNEILNKQQQARINRTPQIIERLNHFGIRVALADIRAETGSPQVGRPHIAQWLVKKGLAASVDEAFDSYLGKGRPGYVEKFRIPADEAIQQILKAGGLAVLAHPGLLDLGDAETYERLLLELMAMGLQGIEVYYPGHSAGQQSFFTDLAAKLALLITGGTDFHGDINPEIRLGIGRGDLYIPYTIYESIMTVLKKNRSNSIAYGK